LIKNCLDTLGCCIINDFQSVGYGIEVLSDEDVVALNQGAEVYRGTRVIIGAGTGQGQSLLVWQGNHFDMLHARKSQVLS